MLRVSSAAPRFWSKCEELRGRRGVSAQVQRQLGEKIIELASSLPRGAPHPSDGHVHALIQRPWRCLRSQHAPSTRRLLDGAEPSGRRLPLVRGPSTPQHAVGATLARWIMGAARPTKLIGRFPHRNYDVAQHHPGDGLTNESHKCVAKVLTGFWDMLAEQGFITPDGAEKLKSCVKVFDQVRLVGVPISFVKCVTLTNYASQHPLAQITRRGRVEVDFDDEAERLCGGAKGVSDLLALHHARLDSCSRSDLAHGKPLAVRFGVPRCRGAFAPSTRLVSIRRGRGGFFDFEATGPSNRRPPSSRGASTRASTSSFSRRPVWWSTSATSCTRRPTGA